MDIKLPSSKPQANVVTCLKQFRKLFLQEALANAIRGNDLREIDRQLAETAPAEDVKELAAAGVRGEFIFPVPALILTKPNLLGYYRLILGYSQKEFYHKGKLGRFRGLEMKGVIPDSLKPQIEPLCRALSVRASELFREIGYGKITAKLLHEMALLTLGPQLRGSNNTRIGKLANRAVFEIIHQIAGASVMQATETRIELLNASKRKVAIAFSSDPDISITEELGGGRTRNVVAIEIKGGEDKSNIWNRLGEAEKSHQSAKARGFENFWTIYNIESLEPEKAREKSPTTQRFYSLVRLASPESEDFVDFRDRLCSFLGIQS